MSTSNRRVALVTGATQGIGRAIAERLAADGARVGINGRSASPAMDEVVELVGGFPVPADMSDPVAIRSAVAEIERTEGPIELLVANAAYMSMGALGEHPEDDWWAVVEGPVAVPDLPDADRGFCAAAAG